MPTLDHQLFCLRSLHAYEFLPDRPKCPNYSGKPMRFCSHTKYDTVVVHAMHALSVRFAARVGHQIHNCRTSTPTDCSQGGQPCTICKQRGHPDICFFPENSDPKRGSKRKRAPGGSQDLGVTASNTPSLGEVSSGSQSLIGKSTIAAAPKSRRNSSRVQSPPGSRDAPSGTASPGATTIGRHSMASFVHDSLEVQDKALSKDFRPGLGLQNHLPDLRSGVNDALHSMGETPMGPESLAKCAQRHEILEFFPSLRICLTMVYPIISNIDELEMAMFAFAQKIEGVIAAGRESSEGWRPMRTTEAALHLALLALGAQFSNKSSGARATVSHDFGLFRRLFSHLRS